MTTRLETDIGEDPLSAVLLLKCALASINTARNQEYSFLKPKQVKCVRQAMDRDVLAILPTGYGKSLIFELLPNLSKLTRGQHSAVLIISPLNSIIEEQVQRYGNMCINLTMDFMESLILSTKVASKTPTEFKQAKFLAGKYSYIICHAEVAIQKAVCDIFVKVWQKIVTHIVIDEVHCVVKWGEGKASTSKPDKSEMAFRPAYSELNKLRAIFPSANFVGLTATATVAMQKKIAATLCLRNPTFITASADRRNTTYGVLKRPPSTGASFTAETSFHEILAPIVEELAVQTTSFPKTIIYTNFKYCGLGYEEVYRKSRTDDLPQLMDLVTQYHAKCTEEMKQTIVANMAKPDTPLCLMFATEAYSMGTDVPDIRRVIHIGPPKDLETYIQECGRAGRDGQPSTATLYYNNSDIGPNVPGMTDEMRKYCRLETCRRDYICEHFGLDEDVNPVGPQDCCNVDATYSTAEQQCTVLYCKIKCLCFTCLLTFCFVLL